MKSVVKFQYIRDPLPLEKWFTPANCGEPPIFDSVNITLYQTISVGSWFCGYCLIKWTPPVASSVLKIKLNNTYYGWYTPIISIWNNHTIPRFSLKTHYILIINHYWPLSKTSYTILPWKLTIWFPLKRFFSDFAMAGAWVAEIWPLMLPTVAWAGESHGGGRHGQAASPWWHSQFVNWKIAI